MTAFDASATLDRLHDLNQHDPEAAQELIATLPLDQLAAVAQLTESEPIDAETLTDGEELAGLIDIYLIMSAENDSE